MKRGEASTKKKRMTASLSRPRRTKTGAEEDLTRKTTVEAEKVESKDKAKVEAPSPIRMKQLLKLREETRRGRPKFLRQESWRYVRIKDAWRRPKGLDSKMRHARKGWPKRVKVSFRGPVEARGLHPSGFREALIHTISDIERLNPETDAVRLASGLGARKRREILKRAVDLGLKVLNPRGLRKMKSKE